MSIFDGNMPYTNLHELNLDWIVRKLKEVENFTEDVEKEIKEEVNAWLEEHPEATTTVQDGSITEQKLYQPMIDSHRVWVNIKSVCPNYVLDDTTISQAILDSLALSKYIYIPDGTYTFNVEISQDCHILLGDECYINTDNQNPCIYAHDCSFSLQGGNVFAGANDDSRTPVYWSTVQSIYKGIIFLENCHDCLIQNVKCSHSKYSAVFRLLGCIDVVIENLKFDNILLSAITLHNYNKNVIVRNCVFSNLKKITGHDYCYAVATGVTDFNDNSIVPPDGLIYENNYVENSEDCALDTHGAKNVIIRNNKILQAVCSITAYNDNGRALRPSGWFMENILIENNYCVSNKNNEAGRQYPHPFIYLGGGNEHNQTEVGYENNYGTYYDYCNCVIRNNYFESSNTYANGLITLGAVSRNVTIENNVIDCHNVNRPFQPMKSINFAIRGNSFKNVNMNVQFLKCCGVFENNSGGKNYASSTTSGNWSCIEGLVQNAVQTGSSVYLKMGQIVEDSGAVKVSTTYGARVKPTYSLPSPKTITVTNGIAELTDHSLIPGLAVKLTDSNSQTSNRYIADVIDFNHFSLVSASNTPVGNGTYTLELLPATLSAL